MSSVYIHALNGTRPPGWRVTPLGQPSVPDLVSPGAALRTSYSTGGIVVAVHGPHTRHWDLAHPPAWSILFVLPQHYGRHGTIPARPFDNPKVMVINDLVAVDRRFLKVCADSSDEVFVTPLTEVAADAARLTQLALVL